MYTVPTLGITISRNKWRDMLSVRAAKKRSESMIPLDSYCGLIAPGSICPEATERTFSKLELQMLYTRPRNDPSSWEGSVANNAKPRTIALASLCSDFSALHSPRKTMPLWVSWMLGTPSATSRAEWWA